MTTQPGKPSLGRRALNSTLWAGAGRAGRAVAQVLFMIVLGRAVGPSGFAAASIALIGYQLTSTLATQSFAQALVRYSDPSPQRDATAFWLNIVLVAFTTVIAATLGDPIANVLDLPSLSWLLPLLTAMGLIAAPTVLAQAQLSRAMEFRQIAIIETASSLIAAALGALAALFGGGLLALVIYAGTQRLIEAVGFLWSKEAWPKVRPGRSAMELLHFTLPLAGMQVVAFANSSVDQFFVGQVGTPQTLGFYGLARRFSQQPTQMITFAINRAIYPALVHARDGWEGQAALFLSTVRISVMAASFPLFLLAVIGPEFLIISMGEEWEDAASFLALFAMTSAVLPVGGVLSAALRAEGRTGLQLLFQSIRLLFTLIVLSFLVYMNVDTWSVAVAVAAITLASLGPPIWEAARIICVPMSSIIANLFLGVFPATMPVIFSVLLQKFITPEMGIHAVIFSKVFLFMLFAALAFSWEIRKPRKIRV